MCVVIVMVMSVLSIIYILEQGRKTTMQLTICEIDKKPLIKPKY